MRLTQEKLARLIVGFLFGTVVAVMWDIWWHSALGRGTFWSPPHLLLYGTVTAAIALGAYGWHRTRERVWRRLAIVLVLIPFVAPFDDLWHRTFGIESVASPIIVWSPPHIVLAGVLAACFIMLLPVLRRDERDAQRLFGSLVFAALLSLALFLTQPVEPTGAYALLGFWGAGIVGAFVVGVLLTARAWIPGIGGATTTAFVYLTLASIGLAERAAPGVLVPPHEHPLSWLVLFAFLAAALFLDLCGRIPAPARGLLAGLLWAGIIYGAAWRFFAPEFAYGIRNALVAIAAGGLGGMAAGLIGAPAGGAPDSP